MRCGRATFLASQVTLQEVGNVGKRRDRWKCISSSIDYLSSSYLMRDLCSHHHRHPEGWLQQSTESALDFFKSSPWPIHSTFEVRYPHFCLRAYPPAGLATIPKPSGFSATAGSISPPLLATPTLYYPRRSRCAPTRNKA